MQLINIYIFQYGVDIFSGSHGKEVLSPKRLDKSRFDYFVKTSAESQPITTQHSPKTPPGKLNYTAQQTTQHEPAVTITEKPNIRAKVQEANISHIPTTNSKLLHDRVSFFYYTCECTCIQLLVFRTDNS